MPILKEMKSKKLDKKTKNKIFATLIGCATGLVNGLFGGGGGMIAVPFLTYALKKEPKVAHATAILIILPLCIVSSLLYTSFGNFRVDIGLPVIIGVVLGGVAGSIILPKISAPVISIIFAVVMAGAGVKMLFF